MRTHWVYDDQQTLCGRFLIDLPVSREFDASYLPGDPCQVCRDLAETGDLMPGARVTLPVSRGILRKTGPLSHGPRSTHRGQRLWGGE